MDRCLVAPCGSYCGICKFLNSKKEKLSCLGCGNQKGQLFWGECKTYNCAQQHNNEHCGLCEDFPCELFLNQFDPAQGQKSVFTRAGLLVYRKKFGTEKFVEMTANLGSEE